MATESNIKGFFAIAINQNRQALIDNMNNLGYSTSSNISNQALVDKLFDIYSTKGSDEISNILSGIKIDQSKNSKQELSAVREVLTGEVINSGSQNKTFLQTLQELWAGTSSTTGASSTTKKEPAVSPTIAALVLIVLSVTIGIVIFKA